MRRVGLGAVAGSALVLCLALAPAFAAESKGGKSQESRERLREVQREIGQQRKRAEEAGRKEASLAKELAALDEDLQKKSRLLRDMEEKLRGSSQRIAKLAKDIGVTEARLGRSRTFLKRRLRAMYKQGRIGYVRMLLSAEDISSVGRRLKYLSALAAQDRRLMQTYGTALADLTQKRTELEQHKQAVAEATEKASLTRNQIVEEQRRRRVLLASVREEKAGHLAHLKELEASAKDLQGLIARLQQEEERQRRQAAKPAPKKEGTREAPGKEPVPDIQDDGRFAQLKGKLPWPAQGSLASGFGRQEHPRFHTVTFNRGIEIAAPQGKDITAVAEGTVIFADWFKGYGRLIILDHGSGYFTLYAHASDILVKAGDGVQGGQVVGKVGDTGSLEGPQLYFELRHKGKPQDPLAWLRPAAR
jgi:septal ring factor EnvC (AmiA/AmiB activator)